MSKSKDQSRKRGMQGKKHSEQTKQRISRALRGRTLSEQTKKSISRACKGKRKHYRNGVNPRKGKTLPEEHIQNMRKPKGARAKRK